MGARSSSFLSRLLQFCYNTYGIRESEITDRHIKAFFDECVEERTNRFGQYKNPLRRSLPEYVFALARKLDSDGGCLRISDDVLDYAVDLANSYAPDIKRAEALSPESVNHILNAIDGATLRGLRLRAAMLVLWQTWARPSEVLSRLYPDDICADNERGVVIKVPRAKTNRTGRPELFGLQHHPNTDRCAVCALKAWIDTLGSDYRGPLFPVVSRSDRVGAMPMKAQHLSTDLQRAAKRAGLIVRYSSYSLRRGGATTAAANDVPFENIRVGLRHEDVVQTFSYIDPRAFFVRKRPL